MRRDGKLSVALHLLTHLAAAGPRPLTSEQLAACLRTNPVVVRRALATLRERGIVASAKGHGGGWVVARSPAAVSLRDVYEALGERLTHASKPESGEHRCPILSAVDRALDGFSDEADLLLRRRLETVSLADLVAATFRGHQREDSA